MAEPLSGVTTTVEVLHNGNPAFAVTVPDFSDDVDLETRSRNVLGQPRSSKNQILRGYKGTITVDVLDPSVALFAARFYAEVDAGIKPDLSILEVSVHADTGATTTRQWMIVTLEGLSRSASGTQNTTQRLTWSAQEMVTR